MPHLRYERMMLPVLIRSRGLIKQREYLAQVICVFKGGTDLLPLEVVQAGFTHALSSCVSLQAQTLQAWATTPSSEFFCSICFRWPTSIFLRKNRYRCHLDESRKIPNLESSPILKIKFRFIIAGGWGWYRPKVHCKQRRKPLQCTWLLTITSFLWLNTSPSQSFMKIYTGKS